MAQREPRIVGPDHNGPATANPGSASVPARPLERLLLSPHAILLGTLALFFAVETFVMLFVIDPLASEKGPFVGAVIDSSIMVSLSAPFLWWFITRSHRATRAVSASEEQTRLIIETAYDAFVAMDTDGLITEWNRQAEDTFGWTRQEAIAKPMELIIPERTRGAHGEGLRHYMATGEGPVLNKRVELVALHRDGHEFPVELAVWPVQSGDTHAFNAFVHDITQRKQDEEALRALNQQLEDDRRQIDEMNLSLEKRIHERTQDLETLNAELRERNRQLLDARSQATTDGLTSVPNHRAFHERIRAEVKHAAKSGSSIGLIMLDIDGFKSFNDSLGHVAGDRILRHCADVLVDTLGHDSVFRYGGDEFAVILVGADEASALETAERLRRAVEARNNGESGVTISLGVAAIPETATTAGDLIYRADAAMYQAKSAGKNRVAGSSSLTAATDRPRPEGAQVSVHRR